MRKILVLRGGALGDLIVTLPALALLRRRWPQARIELAGNATAAALALDAKLIDAAHAQHEARWSALFSAAPLPTALATWLAEFDLVLNFWPDPADELRAHFPIRDGQQFLHANAHPTRAPAAAHYCEALRTLGITTEKFFFALREPQRDARLVALHVGSGSPRKNWPLDRWLALAEWLARERREKLLIVTGEAESDAAPELARVGEHANNLPLRSLADRLAQCRLFIGHDSGVSHLAAACGVPCLLLFGPTDPAIWAPPASHVRVIKRDAEMTSISFAEVQRAVESALAPRK